jgi:hypothetical protein
MRINDGGVKISRLRLEKDLPADLDNTTRPTYKYEVYNQ